MKRLIYLVLMVQSGIALAQTKTVVTQFGERVTIHPNANNGLTAENGNVQLGGDLLKPTTINTSAVNILEIKNTVAGALKITDGTQGAEKILTSDANGIATWQVPVAVLGFGTMGAGVDLPSNVILPKYTGTSIVLPPGKWLVVTNMILGKGGRVGTTENWYLRTSYSDSQSSLSPSADIIGASLVSGNLPSNTTYNQIAGPVIINNTSGSNKTYYYYAVSFENANATGALIKFGGSAWGENNIYWQKIN